MLKRGAFELGAVIATALMASTAQAQQATPDTTGTAPAADPTGDPGLADIVVTAQKREQRLQDIPLAVSAVSGETLKAAGVTNILQVSDLNPTINYTTSDGVVTGNTIKLRGLGTSAQSAGFDPGVGVFLDNVITTRTGVAIFDLIDIDRVEILRGPQGTLFGRNTSFGAINILTKKPSFDFGGEMEASYGNYDSVQLRGAVTGPMSSTLAARLTAGYQHRDGIVKDLNGGRVNTRDRLQLRGQLLWEPTSNLSLRLIGDYSRIKDNCCYAPFVNGSDPTVQSFGNALGGAIPPNPYRDLVIKLTPARDDYSHTKNGGVSAELNWDLGPATLTSISAYRKLVSNVATDTDLTSADIFKRRPLGFNVETWTQELRLGGATKLGGIGLDWILGGFYIDDEVENRLTYLTGKDYQAYTNVIIGGFTRGALTAERLAGVPAGTSLIGAGFGSHDRFFQRTKGYGLFTHNVFNLTSRLDATLGLRYSSEKKNAGGDISTDPQFRSFCNILRRLPIPQLNVPVNLLTCPFFIGATPALPGSLDFASFRGRRHDDDISGTARLSYRFDGLLPDFMDKLLVFGGFSRGFKGGGFNLDRTQATYPTLAAQTAGLPVQDPGFRPERVDSYELGFKTTLFDRRFTADVTAFRQRIKDLQALNFNGVAFLVGNIEQFHRDGVEVELAAAPVKGLALNAGYLLTTSYYPRNQTFLPIFATLAGSRQSTSPRNTFTFGAAVTLPVPSAGLQVSLGGDGRIESSQLTTGAANSRVSGRENYNARLAVTHLSSQISLELWGRNLSNNRTPRLIIQTLFPSTGLVGYPDDPRTYGITLRKKF